MRLQAAHLYEARTRVEGWRHGEPAAADAGFGAEDTIDILFNVKGLLIFPCEVFTAIEAVRDLFLRSARFGGARFAGAAGTR